MAKSFTISGKILEKYADVLVNFALSSGKGIKKGDVVRIVARESSKPLFIELRKAVLKAGGHIIAHYGPEADLKHNPAKDFYELASRDQLTFFPEKYYKGLVDTIDHNVVIISEENKKELEGVDPKKIMLASGSMKLLQEWLRKKENQKKFTWTLGLFGTPAMAREAGLSLKTYWDQIIKACFLDKKNPVQEWKKVFEKLEKYRKKLNQLPIEKFHIKGKDIDLWISQGEKRAWVGGTGRNIPSFELFTSPDWRGTEGWIRFNQPLYRYGNLITGIELWFKNGRVVKSKARKNHKVLKEMIKQKNADKVGEFSMTDKRFSRITAFMAETLYDENVGGKYGNTHIALGASYHDCYGGDPSKVTKKGWEKLGFNDSAVHTDIISTTDRIITAYLKDGKKRVVYKNGQYTI